MKKILELILIACLPVILFAIAFLAPVYFVEEEEVIPLNPNQQLENAFEAINNSSVTIKVSSTVDSEMIVNGKTDNIKTTTYRVVEKDATSSFIVSSMDGLIISEYFRENAGFVDRYFRFGTNWDYLESIPVEEYVDKNFANLEYDLNSFKLIDGIYCADLEIFSDVMYDQYKVQFSQNGQRLTKCDCLKYNITLKDGNIDQIEYENVLVVRDALGQYIYNITTVMRFEKIGETKVTVPYKLPSTNALPEVIE